MARIDARAGVGGGGAFIPTNDKVLSDADYQARLDGIASSPLMREDNITLSEGSANAVATAFGVVGVLGLIGTVVGSFVHNVSHALAAFEVGLFTVLACCLGCLGVSMIFWATNAGWVATIRRQFENVAATIWVPLVMLGAVVLIELLGPGREGSGVLLTWLLSEKQGTYLIEHKSGFLNPLFFAIRFVIYAAVWMFLASRLAGLSREHDRTADRGLSRKARFMSGWGLLAFALTTAFAAFDYLMSMDYRFFSTMWGVYYFAISALSGVSLVAVILSVVRTRGRLTGLVNEEHFHDLGKLVFAFTVFWAYIAFSQYFLIWYSNIPEETAYYLHRQSGGWKWFFVFLCLAHFVLPFVVLMVRGVKKSTLGLGAMGVYMLLLTVADLFFAIKPMVYVAKPWAPEVNPGLAGLWLDAAGVLAAAGIFGFFLVRRIASGPLVPLKDPFLHEALHHKNYV